MKKAYIFPGQGSQFPGMAKDLYDGNSIARDMLEQANEILGFRITDIMFDGTAEDLKATKVTQPAIFLHSVALAATMEDFTPDMVAGHSLGEFSALAAAKAIRFEDALRLVAIRAREMQKCCEMVPGTMAAILGLDFPERKKRSSRLVPRPRNPVPSAPFPCRSAEPSTPRLWNLRAWNWRKPSNRRKSCSPAARCTRMSAQPRLRIPQKSKRTSLPNSLHP